jgi:TorA maturation chaperone TorD
MNSGRDAISDAAEVETYRAAFYALIARILMRPPEPEFLNQLQGLTGDDTPLGAALNDLARAAAGDPEAIQDEYSLLFYGMGQGGELLPYASYYLTGSLHDRPLAALRTDMERLGIQPGNLNGEPEDHIAILLEMMHGLITGGFGAGTVDVDGQMKFFHAHIAPWGYDFFVDLEAAQSARFYAAVARVGRAFLAVEQDAFQMAA